MATTRPFVVDATLTAVAIGYKNGSAMRIADKVLPRLPVSNEKFKYTVYPISEAFNTPDARVGRKGVVKQLEFTGTEITSDVVDYGLDSPIPQSDIDVATAARAEGRTVFDPEARATALSRAWGKHMALLYLNPLASVEQGGITFGFTAQYGDRMAGRIEDPDIGLQGGFRIRTGERVRELISAQDVGYFIQNAVA